MRKLAAIMFTDIAGFTALSAKNEAGALDLLDKQRDILKPIVEEFGGSWLKEMGDGLLISFSSSHRALSCAISIQEAVREIDDLNLRIGIHQGDIIERDGDVFGDDVNIASRIEPFAAIGGVAISDKVYRDISGNPEFEANYIGRPKLKGVKQEVGVYSIVSHGLPETRLSEVVAKLEKEPIPWTRYAIPVVLAIVAIFYFYLGGGGINSIAVLPFENQSGDNEKDYIVAGMYTGLISELSQLSALRVISRRSAAKYKGSDKSLSEIARELDVDAVVEAVVLRAGDILNLRVELVKARPEEQNLWGQSFERDLTDALTLYSDIVRAIAGEINISLTPQEEARLSDTRQVNRETYAAYLKGMYNLNKSEPGKFEEGMAYLFEAVESNPGDPLAYTGLADGYINMGHGPAPPPDVWSKARAATVRALKLDSTLAEAHGALADIKLYYEWDWAGAEKAFDRALEINPNLAMTHYHHAWYLALVGQLDEAIIAHKQAKELDPLTASHAAWLGELYRFAGQYQNALELANESLDMGPDFGDGMYVMGNTYADMDRLDEAITAHEKMYAVAPWWGFALGITYVRAGIPDKALPILAELEAEESSAWGAFSLLMLNAALGNMDEAYRWLAYEPAHAFLPWINIFPELEPFRADPRYAEFRHQLNLPG